MRGALVCLLSQLQGDVGLFDSKPCHRLVGELAIRFST